MNGHCIQDGEASESPEPPGSGPCRPRFWWERRDLRYRSHSERSQAVTVLHFGERRLEDFVDEANDLPVFVYSPRRVREKVEQLRTTIPEATLLYAVKANRHPALLGTLLSCVDGIDVCSPAEIRLALANGFREDQISYTGTSLSDRDLDVLVAHPAIHVNADSLSFLRRLTAKCPGRVIGVRINPEQGIGYRNESRLVYSDRERPGKFGLLHEQIPEALEIVRKSDCRIDTVHWHIGCGWLGRQLNELGEILRRATDMVAMFPEATKINLGGGLGVPFQSDDGLLPLDAWAKTVRETVAGRWNIYLEPGSFLVQDAGVLLVQVNTVERKRRWTFVGVNAGFNLVPEPVFYGMPLEPAFLTLPEPERSTESLTIAGNINEGHDLLVRDFSMPLPKEGDWLALLNAGAYAASMASNHCLRGEFLERILEG